MTFSYQAWLMNPFVLMCISLITGIVIGKIRIGRFDFGSSGVLFTGMFISWGVMNYAQSFTEQSPFYQIAQKLISVGVIDISYFNLFLVLFIAAVGLLVAKDIGAIMKRYGLKFIVLGVVITAVGAACTYGAAVFNQDMNHYEVSGVYTGSLTSSPGLAAALETAKDEAQLQAMNYAAMSKAEKERFLRVLDKTGTIRVEQIQELNAEMTSQYIRNAEAGVGIGYAIGYPFGVLIVILAMNLIPGILGIDLSLEKEKFRREMEEVRVATSKSLPEGNFDLVAFALVCISGYTIGMIELNLSCFGLGMFSLGSTGGVLIGALFLGHIGKIGPLNFRMDEKILGSIRDIALGFFLAIVGLRYGFSAFDAVARSGLYLAIVSILVGTIAILVGVFIGRYIFKINWIILSGAICGGMTSTPGLGAAVDSVGSDDPAAGYGATYPFALLGMVIFTIILHKLPL
ncbi:MAG: hypothetical protein CVU87_04895 [Firmicutes bacterium HGW-Firmicutes-12]|nr:MAG: hypothetical protein CVU87_04895 [Firmicutes bacterium HGW-Firmicutes-12]